MQNKKVNIQNLCLSAVMAAIYFALDLAATTLSVTFFGNTMKISFSGLAVIIPAVFCGPLWGCATGFIGAFLGQMLSYGFTPTTLLWVLPAALRGLSMGLLFIAFKRSQKISILSLEIILSSLLVTAVNTVVMYIDSKIYNYYSYAYIFGGLLPRVIASLITAVIFTLLLPVILKMLSKVIKNR